MSELIGCIIGDGNIYDKSVSYVELAGDADKDRLYFENVLYGLVKNELEYEPKIFFHSGALRLRINNKMFVRFLNGIGIPSGYGKSKSVLVPPSLIGSSIEVKKSYIRGIFDTDGSVYYDKRSLYKKPYIRIELHMFNDMLLSQIRGVLVSLGLPVAYSVKRQALYFNGYENVKKYIDEIGFSNPRHLKKIKNMYPELIQSETPQ